MLQSFAWELHRINSHFDVNSMVKCSTFWKFSFNFQTIFQNWLISSQGISVRLEIYKVGNTEKAFFFHPLISAYLLTLNFIKVKWIMCITAIAGWKCLLLHSWNVTSKDFLWSFKVLSESFFWLLLCEILHSLLQNKFFNFKLDGKSNTDDMISNDHNVWEEIHRALLSLSKLSTESD